MYRLGSILQSEHVLRYAWADFCGHKNTRLSLEIEKMFMKHIGYIQKYQDLLAY